MWVFGYGSLVWRPAFPYSARRPAFIRGWRRRFWQGSPDHRGTPERPGRVATLIRAPRHEICWGVAYQLGPIHRCQILSALDAREIAGYEKLEVPLYGRGRAAPFVAKALLYVAGPDNESFLGAAPLGEIARHVARSRGPSGHNRDYVLRLDAALRALGGYDAEVAALAASLT